MEIAQEKEEQELPGTIPLDEAWVNRIMMVSRKRVGRYGELFNWYKFTLVSAVFIPGEAGGMKQFIKGKVVFLESYFLTPSLDAWIANNKGIWGQQL